MRLEDLFDELRDMDVTDPVCMDKVILYLDEIEKEIDDFMEVLVQKLSCATISWQQPWYQESTKLTGYKIENREDMPKFLMDSLNSDESERVKKNWHKLVKKYKIPDNLAYFARWRNTKGRPKEESPEVNVRRFINSYLARGLERTIPQVYQHVVNQYAHPPKGRYTKDEEKIMEICFHHCPKRAVRIAAIVLDRGPRGILQKINRDYLNDKPEISRIRWNLSLATKLLKLLMLYTGESLEGLKNKHIEIGIWRKIENHFDTQAYYLRYFWYTSLHCQLFVKYDVTLRRVRKRVFKILRSFPYKYWTDIRWKQVVDHLPDGFTFQFLYRVTIRIFRKNRVHTKLPLEDVLRIGMETTNHKGFGNKRLKTLVVNEQGDLEVFRYSNKL